MRWRIATASARCSLVITALLVSQFSAVSESCVAKALRITDDDWAQSSGLSKPRAMAASMTGSGISTVSRQAFAASLAMAAHAQRVGPQRMRLGDVLDAGHGISVTPFRGSIARPYAGHSAACNAAQSMSCNAVSSVFDFMRRCGGSKKVAAYDVALGALRSRAGSDTTRWLTSGSHVAPLVIVAAAREIRMMIRGSLPNVVKMPAISTNLVGLRSVTGGHQRPPLRAKSWELRAAMSMWDVKPPPSTFEKDRRLGVGVSSVRHRRRLPASNEPGHGVHPASAGPCARPRAISRPARPGALPSVLDESNVDRLLEGLRAFETDREGSGCCHYGLAAANCDEVLGTIQSHAATRRSSQVSGGGGLWAGSS